MPKSSTTPAPGRSASRARRAPVGHPARRERRWTAGRPRLTRRDGAPRRTGAAGDRRPASAAVGLAAAGLCLILAAGCATTAPGPRPHRRTGRELRRGGDRVHAGPGGAARRPQPAARPRAGEAARRAVPPGGGAPPLGPRQLRGRPGRVRARGRARPRPRGPPGGPPRDGGAGADPADGPARRPDRDRGADRTYPLPSPRGAGAARRGAARHAGLPRRQHARHPHRARPVLGRQRRLRSRLRRPADVRRSPRRAARRRLRVGDPGHAELLPGHRAAHGHGGPGHPRQAQRVRGGGRPDLLREQRGHGRDRRPAPPRPRRAPAVPGHRHGGPLDPGHAGAGGGGRPPHRGHRQAPRPRW